MPSKPIQPTIFDDFGVPLFLIGSDIPAHLRDLAPIGLNWIIVPQQTENTPDTLNPVGAGQECQPDRDKKKFPFQTDAER